MRMKNTDILKIGAIILVIFALVWIFRAVFNDEQNMENNDGRREAPEETIASEAFQDLSIENLDGETSSIEEHEGRPILMTFWEEDDEDSQEQLAILDNLLLLLEQEVAFLSVYEPEGREVPYTVVIDQQGVVFQEYSELTTEETLLADVEQLLERNEP